MNSARHHAVRPEGPRSMGLATLIATIALATPSASAFTINPRGGDFADDGLRVEFAPNTQLQVWRQRVSQANAPATSLPSASVNNGVFIAVGERVYGAASAACGAEVSPWTPISQTGVVGDGNASNPWRGTTVVRAGDDGPVLTIETSYALPDDFISMRVTVEIGEGDHDRAPVRLYHVFDTNLDGSGDGPAFMGPGASPRSVGARSNGAYAAFSSASPVWDDWLSASAATAFSRVASGGDLLRAVDDTPSTDNAIAAQWNLGASGRHVVSYHMVFTARTPCSTDAECGGAGYCDVVGGLCVGCVSDAQCGGATPVCDVMMHTCAAVGDTDADGDGATDTVERAAGTNPAAPDSDLDTVPDGEELGPFAPRPVDTDGDGVINALDNDDDGDGLLTRDEYPRAAWGDNDGDGVWDYLDADDDDDGILTRDERPDGMSRDTDGNGVPDHLEADDDHDGILTRIETSLDHAPANDADGDGLPSYRDTDSDGDTVPDSAEMGLGLARDTDGDGAPDFVDPDDDNDDVSTRVEAASADGTPPDTDADGAPDYRDSDSDNDCAPDNAPVEAGPSRVDMRAPSASPDNNCTSPMAPVCDTRRGLCVSPAPVDPTDASADASTDASADASTDAAVVSPICSGATPLRDPATGRCVASPDALTGGFSCDVHHGSPGGGSDATGLALIGLALCAIVWRRRAR